VIRIDQRGFGESTAMAEDFAWSLDVLVGDLEKVVTMLDAAPVHLIASKIAGPVIMRFAATRPELTASITVVGSLAKGPPDIGEWLDYVRRHGVAAWARHSMPPRLGSDMSPEGLDWWVNLMSKTPSATVLGLFPVVPQIDVTPDLPNIRCPALVITTDSKRRPVAKTREWQSRIPGSVLTALPGDAYHPAASFPDACARITREFLDRVSGVTARAP
jgi:pimeloyl-ACP methyl ester carboxylesterase